jgi:hypothetical protein
MFATILQLAIRYTEKSRYFPPREQCYRSAIWRTPGLAVRKVESEFARREHARHKLPEILLL